jgi:hypothetical protein
VVFTAKGHGPSSPKKEHPSIGTHIYRPIDSSDKMTTDRKREAGKFWIKLVDEPSLE